MRISGPLVVLVVHEQYSWYWLSNVTALTILRNIHIMNKGRVARIVVGSYRFITFIERIERKFKKKNCL